jgi:hypothetical protein
MPKLEPSTSFLIRLIGTGVCWLLGILPILAGLGLLDTKKPVEPLAIPFVLLFGLVFIALGTAFVFLPVRQLVRNRGARNWKEVVKLAARLLINRIDARAAAAAVGVGILAMACIANIAGATIPFLGEQKTLAAAVDIEFITIHAFPFLVVAIWFLTHTTGAARGITALVTLILVAGYGTLAWAFGGGLLGIGWLIYLLVPNLLVFVRTEKSTESITLATTRWALKFALFVIVAAIVGGGGSSAESTIAVGALYFTLLAFLELVRMVEVPLDLARAVAKAT